MLDHRIITLLTVCEQGSFTAAAEALSLTQPAVSHHIRQFLTHHSFFLPLKTQLYRFLQSDYPAVVYHKLEKKARC